eukprot:8423239-Alexandrium_andersonii.AAC.1
MPWGRVGHRGAVGAPTRCAARARPPPAGARASRSWAASCSGPSWRRAPRARACKSRPAPN